MAEAMHHHLVKLIDAGKYEEAIAFSNNNLAKQQKLISSERMVIYLMHHINVLYSAIGAYSLGGFVQKMKGLWLVHLMNKYTSMVWEEIDQGTDLCPGEYHVLMSVASCNLQIINRLWLTKIAKGAVKFHGDRLLNAANLLGKLAANEKIEPHIRLGQYNLGVARRLHLMASGVLYELDRKGAFPWPRKDAHPCDVKDFIWCYCIAHQDSTDRDTVQAVVRLLRYIGEHVQANLIAKRSSTPDQINKSTLKAA